MNAELSEIYRPIKKDLSRVEVFLRDELESDDALTSRLSESILNNPGKRLRPALALFSAYSVLGKREEKRFGKGLITLAAAIELIHTAALVHDDAVDHSTLRRYQPTVNARYGNDTAVAFGDYLYTKGIEILARLGNPEIVSCLTSAAADMCEGELIQILNRGNFRLKRQAYMTIIRKKTASFMSSSCSAATMLVDKKGVSVGSFSSFGLNLGIAFQIIDDCMDLAGRQRDAGKSIGLDLRMGELTLPLFFLMESNIDKDIKELRGQIYPDETDSRQGEIIREMLLDSGALLKAKNIAAGYAEEAKGDLKGVKDSIFKERLMGLADFTLRKIGTTAIF